MDCAYYDIYALDSLNAESEPLVMDVEEVKLFEKVTCLCKYLLIHTCIVELCKWFTEVTSDTRMILII